MKHDVQKKQLTEQLTVLEVRLKRINKDLSKLHPQDFSEQVTERENDEVLEEIAKETANSIARLKVALHQIDNGSYGLCNMCNKPISNARLQAIPEATHCVNCAK